MYRTYFFTQPLHQQFCQQLLEFFPLLDVMDFVSIVGSLEHRFSERQSARCTGDLLNLRSNFHFVFPVDTNVARAY